MSEVKEFDIKWTMVVDLDKCTGCGACMVACQAENNVAPNPDGTNKVRSINWMKVYRLSNHKPFPEHDTAYLFTFSISAILIYLYRFVINVYYLKSITSALGYCFLSNVKT